MEIDFILPVKGQLSFVSEKISSMNNSHPFEKGDLKVENYRPYFYLKQLLCNLLHRIAFTHTVVMKDGNTGCH
jgi:hypothetical protein